MQEQLLGYLLGALDDDESRDVELALQHEPHLQEELQHLEASLQPLEAGREPYDPPPGLAQKTCQAVASLAAPDSDSSKRSPMAAALKETSAEKATLTPASLSPTREAPVGSSRMSLSDLSVAGGVFLAAGLLLLPAIEHSRFVAQQTTCANNLREIGKAAIHYSQQHEGYFPEIEAEGNLSVAGVFPVRLVDGGYLEDATPLVCPTSARSNAARAMSDGSERGQPPRVPIPSVEELRQVRDPRTIRLLHQTMGGDYAYTLGSMEGDVYAGSRNRNRSHFPIVVDRPIIHTVNRNAPSIQLAGNRSANHGGHGQNVLFEDGHVRWTSDCVSDGKDRVDYARRDDFYKNDEGNLAAGLHADDAVCVPGNVQPVPKFILRFPQ